MSEDTLLSARGLSLSYGALTALDQLDLVLERGNATVLIDPVSVGFLAGSEIDFVDDLIGSAFKITNPNAKSSCGCGTSFSL